MAVAGMVLLRAPIVHHGNIPGKEASARSLLSRHIALGANSNCQKPSRASRLFWHFVHFVLDAFILLVFRQSSVRARWPSCHFAGDSLREYARTSCMLNSTLSLPILLDHDSVVTLALPLVTLTPSALAFARISTRFLDDTACAISAAYVLLCMRRRSTSLVL